MQGADVKSTLTLASQVYQSTNNIEKANQLIETLEGWSRLSFERRRREEEKVNQDQEEAQRPATISLFQLLRTLAMPSDAKLSE